MIKKMTTMTLDSLKEKLKEWKGCELSKTANPVLGEGNPQAEIVFIGEVPAAGKQRSDARGERSLHAMAEDGDCIDQAENHCATGTPRTGAFLYEAFHNQCTRQTAEADGRHNSVSHLSSGCCIAQRWASPNIIG